MADVTLTFSAPASGGDRITSYNVVFTYNGVTQPVISVLRTSALDGSGYSVDFDTAFPAITIGPGDTIGATVQSVDATDNLSGAIVASSPPTVTEPAANPADPANVVLTLIA